MLAICSAYFHGFGLNAIQKVYNRGDNRQPHKLITVTDIHKFVLSCDQPLIVPNVNEVSDSLLYSWGFFVIRIPADRNNPAGL